MSTPQYTVFVYGTLKPGGHYWAAYCEGRVLQMQDAKVRGALYDLHLGYPGLVLGGSDWVYGLCMQFGTAADLARLDELEGYQANRDARQNEYQRLSVDCFDLRDQFIGNAWVYEISPAVLKRCRGTRLWTGNWPV